MLDDSALSRTVFHSPVEIAFKETLPLCFFVFLQFSVIVIAKTPRSVLVGGPPAHYPSNRDRTVV